MSGILRKQMLNASLAYSHGKQATITFWKQFQGRICFGDLAQAHTRCVDGQEPNQESTAIRDMYLKSSPALTASIIKTAIDNFVVSFAATALPQAYQSYHHFHSTIHTIVLDWHSLESAVHSSAFSPLAQGFGHLCLALPNPLPIPQILQSCACSMLSVPRAQGAKSHPPTIVSDLPRFSAQPLNIYQKCTRSLHSLLGII